MAALIVEGEDEGRDDDVGRAMLGLNEDLEAAAWGVDGGALKIGCR